MNKDKILTGYDIVSKGTTKLGATLPEAGLKEIFPNGSWLEKKQIQAALEARKHLIEVERIEKSGILSHAVWREELMMAEVTQKVGGYWQYLGQNKGKDLFLHPEETLFLMEINCLHLTHNDLKVSLQQAYTLLLRGKITLLKYKVYASLSRLGYRVFRHIIIDNIKANNENSGSSEEINDRNCVETNDTLLNKDKITYDDCKIKEELHTENNEDSEKFNQTPVTSKPSEDNSVKHKNIRRWRKLEKIKKRKLRPCDSDKLHEYFESVPEMLNKTIVVCKVADKKYLPQGLNPRKSMYCVNLEKILCKSDQPSSDSTYNPNDEINGIRVPRIRHISARSSNSNMSVNYQSLLRQFSFRPCRFRRPIYNFNDNHINTMFGRSFLPNTFIVPPYQFLLRPQPYMRPQMNNQTLRNIKRKYNIQIAHLESIKKLTFRLKNLFQNGHFEQHNVDALRKLIQTYNFRYRANIRLTDDFDIIVGEVVDTITLEDDEPVEKRPRITDNDTLLNENLNSLKQFAAKLKNLETVGKSSARHRRCFSKLLKTFNQSYNEEYYITETHELENKRHVTVDSSDSDSSDCVMKDVPEFPKGKKLKNPFNVLKRLSEKQKETNEASTSGRGNAAKSSQEMSTENRMYSKKLLDAISPKWLPNVNDFGRAEIVAKNSENNELLDIRQEEFLYDFMNLKPCQSNNWLDLKKSYYNSIKEAVAEFQNSIDNNTDSRVNSIVKPQDCLNMASVLKKLSIIQTEKGVKDECSLVIDFDVYNRDVQNFRKTDKPVPHFRMLCLSLSSNMPSGDEIAALHSKYKDNVVIIFAVVGDSISYVQVNPVELPVYLSNN